MVNTDVTLEEKLATTVYARGRQIVRRQTGRAALLLGTAGIVLIGMRYRQVLRAKEHKKASGQP